MRGVTGRLALRWVDGGVRRWRRVSGFIRDYFGDREQMYTDLGAEFDEIAPTLMVRLREQAMQKIESERWMYEPLDRYQAQLH